MSRKIIVTSSIVLVVIGVWFGIKSIFINKDKEVFENQQLSVNQQPIADLESDPNLKIHANYFYEESSFYQAVLQVEASEVKCVDKQEQLVSGGIIPHHLLPGFIIANFFECLSVQNPETVILIGPNHYEKGGENFLTSQYGWETPFGIVEPNSNMIKQLIANQVVGVDEAVLPFDHSVAGIMPFIKYYLPNTTVVPIIISAETTSAETEELAIHLAKYLNSTTVMIAAVDFSHYLNSQEAQQRDEQTISIINNFDYRQLFSLSNKYVDSPQSIATLLMAMEHKDTTNSELLHHTNSGQLTKDDFIETTSYFSIVYF